MPTVHIIVAMTRNHVIGRNGHLPWTLPEDLQLFRRLTLDKTILMGRATYSSIGHPLPRRNNIVISRDFTGEAGITVRQNFNQGLDLAIGYGVDVYCIGGAEIYRQALPYAEFLHISWVDGEFEGDCFFPQFEMCDWLEMQRQHFKGFLHCTYRRRNVNAP